MSELIKVEINSVDGCNVNTVNAKDLHLFLEVGRDFSTWIKARIKKYSFVSGKDFLVGISIPPNGGTVTEYFLTIDMAKELSMVERNEKGKQARQYFIECEKRALSPVNQLSSMPKSEALLLAAELAKKVEDQEQQLQIQAPKVLFADTVASSETSILVGQLAKIISQKGVKIGANRLFAHLRDNGFLSKRRGCDWNMPNQRYVEQGLFEIKESSHSNPDGSTRITKTPKVTGKGQIYFVNKFAG